jgi:hypothetical protein
MENPFEGLMEHIRKMAAAAQGVDCQKKLLAKLNENERDEFVSMIAESSRVNNAIKALQEEKEIIDARAKIFWFKIKRAHKLVDATHLQIADDGTAVYEVVHKESDDE